MRIICLIGMFVTLLYVLVNYILNIHSNLFTTEQNSILFVMNVLLLVIHYIFFAIYTYRRKFTMVFVLWIITFLSQFWYYYHLFTFDWSVSHNQKDYEAFRLYGDIYSGALAILAIAFLVSKARKRIPLVVYALVSLIALLLSVKNWIPADGFTFLILINILSPLIIALNYLLELKNYKPDAYSPIRKRTKNLTLDEIE